MIVHIPNVLAPATLNAVNAALGSLEFVEGKTTAGWHAQGVKSNHQAKASAGLAQVQNLIVAALTENAVFTSLVLPLRYVPPLISRTDVGEGYGLHVDDALMGKDALLRTDLSVTVFLSDPKTYEGGELVVETPSGADEAKFAAGDAAVYPATTLHRVNPVTKGVRTVAATWVQSRVRDGAQREILFDLDRARRQIFAEAGKTPTFDLITKSYANLLRAWAEV